MDEYDAIFKNTAPATTGYVATFVKVVLVEGVKASINKLDERIEALEKKLEDYEWMKGWVEDLSRRPHLKYAGTWKRDSEYGNREGEFVTHEGSVWYCRTYTKDEPGTNTDWQLAVKRASPK